MTLLALIIFELLLLFLLSNRISSALYHLLVLIFRNKYVASGILTFIYLPGTVSHEFAHLIIAEILRVPTGELSFTPKIAREENNRQEISLGSVQVAKTDPFRNFLIAIAPVLSGLFFLLLLIWLWQHFYPQMDTRFLKIGLTALIGYFLFAVSNGMFSSDKDMQGTWFLPIIVVMILIALYFSGVRINITGQLLTTSITILKYLTKSLGIVIGVNLVVLLVNVLILNNLRKLR